jgi:hypothetical protein
MTLENELPVIRPIQFFALACDCFSLNPNDEHFPSFAQHQLPSTQHLTGEISFAKLAMGWSEEGLAFLVQVNQPATASFYPQVSQGDSIELFVDTRDLKSAGFNTRFCHHFFFLPQSVENISKGEITHFRTEDSHPLCDPQALEYQKASKKNHDLIKIFIPSQCLYGYDPKQFDRLGFTYRINRHRGQPQHFSVVTEDFQIDQQPSLWGSLKLVK